MRNDKSPSQDGNGAVTGTRWLLRQARRNSCSRSSCLSSTAGVAQVINQPQHPTSNVQCLDEDQFLAKISDCPRRLANLLRNECRFGMEQ
jgi:hypothetical protein